MRSGLPAGALACPEPRASQLDGDPLDGALLDGAWVELDPWAPDAAFAHATDLLRAHIARAYELAEAGSEA